MNATQRIIWPAVVAVVLAGAMLTPAGTAFATDVRGLDPHDRLFYGVPITQDITAFGTDPDEPVVYPNTWTCYQGSFPATNARMSKTAWYRLVGTGGQVRLSTSGSTNGASPMDTVLAVYWVANPDPFACSDDTIYPTDPTSSLTIATDWNAVYEVQAGIYGSSSCNGLCTLHLAATNLSAPVNDDRANAIALTSSVMSDNRYASEEPGEATECPNPGPNQNVPQRFAKTVWYSFAALAGGTATFDSGGGVIDTVEALYEGDSPTFLACNDDDGSGTFNARITASVSRGTTYFLQVASRQGSGGGPLSASVDFVADPDLGGDGTFGVPVSGGPATLAPTATPAPCVVPRLKGRSLKASRTKLRKAHCALGAVKGEKTATAKVKAQKPDPGRVVVSGGRVNVKLSG